MGVEYDPSQLKAVLEGAQDSVLAAEAARSSAASAFVHLNFSGYRYPDGMPAPRPRADIPYPEGHMYTNEG